MLTVTKEIKWEMAHRLEKHTGLCNNVHGHNYRALITVKKKHGELIHGVQTSKGMVVDFKNLKKILNEKIVDIFDHAFAYNKNDEQSNEIAIFMRDIIGQKLAPMNYRMTAENMAKWIYKTLNAHFSSNGGVEYGIKCTQVILYENDQSYSTYEE